MKIRKVVANNKRRAFEVFTRNQHYDYPYAVAEPPPRPRDPVERLYIDDEVAREGFAYVLKSGREGYVLWDHVLEQNRDPAYITDLLVHILTSEAAERMAASKLSKREVMRRLGTSASQLYRLLDPTNYRKSLGQVIQLLGVLGYTVKLTVKRRRRLVEPKRGLVPPEPPPGRSLGKNGRGRLRGDVREPERGLDVAAGAGGRRPAAHARAQKRRDVPVRAHGRRAAHAHRA
jgi:antitoxin HicB